MTAALKLVYSQPETPPDEAPAWPYGHLDQLAKSYFSGFPQVGNALMLLQFDFIESHGHLDPRSQVVLDELSACLSQLPAWKKEIDELVARWGNGHGFVTVHATYIQRRVRLLAAMSDTYIAFKQKNKRFR